MKWYKKQLDEILAAKAKEEKPKKAAETKSKAAHSFDAKKLTAKGKNNFVSPVAARNRNRSKTDSL